MGTSLILSYARYFELSHAFLQNVSTLKLLSLGPSENVPKGQWFHI